VKNNDICFVCKKEFVLEKREMRFRKVIDTDTRFDICSDECFDRLRSVAQEYFNRFINR
jgi:hypothetical protein